MVAAPITTSFDTDLVWLINDTAYLAWRPARYHQYDSIGTNVNAIATVPTSGGLHAVFLATDSGPALVNWDESQNNPIVTTWLTGVLSDWDEVTQLWVQDLGTKQRVFGLDGKAGKLRRANCTSGTWTDEGEWLVKDQVVDLAFVELDSSSTGEEVVIQFQYHTDVMSADGATELDTWTCAAGDRIQEIKGFSGLGADFLARSYQSGGSIYLEVFNESTSSNALAMSVQAKEILPRIDAVYGEHLLVTQGGLGDVLVVELQQGSGGSVLLAAPTAGDHLDTYPGSTQRPILQAVTADLDLDGYEDLALTIYGASGPELVYCFSTDTDDLRVTPGSTDPSVADLGSDQYRLDLPMDIGSGLTGDAVEVEVWVVKDPANSSTLEFLAYEQVTLTGNPSTYTFGIEFEATDWDTGEAHFFATLGGVDVVAGEVTGAYTPVALAWADANATVPLPSDRPCYWISASGEGMDPAPKESSSRRNRSNT
ncbi:MAG: hypothetical protein R3F33_03850 [Planctomycetota bacterium]